jgi:hypothetical protein
MLQLGDAVGTVARTTTRFDAAIDERRLEAERKVFGAAGARAAEEGHQVRLATELQRPHHAGGTGGP